MTTTLRGWETLEKLGEGGQSEVYKVRRPERVSERLRLMQQVSQKIVSASRMGAEAAAVSADDGFGTLLDLGYQYARPDLPSELGALKLFKIPDGQSSEAGEAEGRLLNELTILKQNRPGLVRFIDGDAREQWVVTEYIPSGSLDKQIRRYEGRVYAALVAFRSIVETVASLHQDGIIHRDIKPANVFPDSEGTLILGDFGIVFLPEQSDRLTMTNERVGPRDYMPQWGDLGERLDKVQTNFDVYMLGKLLWCMVRGRLKLPREYHDRAPYDLCKVFVNDPNMRVVSDILKKCVVEDPERCLSSARELLQVVDHAIATVQKGLPMLDAKGKFIAPCRVCGKGFYQEHTANARLLVTDALSRPENPIHLRVFVCDVCCHYELFAPNFPEQAAQKGWTAWRTS